MTYLTSLQNISQQDASRFGGKAASLGEMIQAGFPVPPGFAIDSAAHRAFDSRPLPPEFRAELAQQFKALGAQRVAVRSSAIAEDSSSASWAGQLESYLNVKQPQLELAIRDCWKSMQSSHAQAYAQDKQLHPDDLLVGVVVQTMIDPDAAGVMFTLNPVNNDPNSLIIEAAFGLGEAVVQGIVTPDNYQVSVRTGEVTNFGIAVKERMVVYRQGRTQTVSPPARIADRAVLRESQVQTLAQLGLTIAHHYGSPQDIEWCLTGGKFYIVQARPITTIR